MPTKAPNLLSCVMLAVILFFILSLLPLISSQPTSVAPTLQITAAPTMSTINYEGRGCVAIALAIPKLFTLTGNFPS